MGADNFVKSAKESELREGSMKPVHVKGRSILLVRKGGEIFAVSNRCPHEGCSFQGGILREYVVMCPCHGWKFDVRNGEYEENKEIKLVSYRCKIQNGKIYVEFKDKI
jgi:nitrite reductase/ring-hydroxylating ferredoxin subunit